MHFCFIFVVFAFQGVHSSHFSHHFSFHFLDHSDHSSAKHMKMSQKWPKNVYCEQPYILFAITILMDLECDLVPITEGEVQKQLSMIQKG